VVVEDILGVKIEAPDAMDEPPVLAVNQLTVPAEGVAPITTAPVPIREPGLVAVIVGIGVTVTEVIEALKHVPSVPVIV